MALSSGSRLGPYEISGPLGAGGMGEVYKARDTRLDRTVAIKILPQTLAADPLFRERFDREARAIAALTHPHICTLYDVGHQEGTDFLVLEYLEGETLADRLSRVAGSQGPGLHHDVGRVLSDPPGLPVDQALTIAIQIADALDTAHRHGITHRDLKPGNIFLCSRGPTPARARDTAFAGRASRGRHADEAVCAKLLDFGLAKQGTGWAGEAGRAGAAGRVADAPTMSSPITAQGTILGTFQYMAPEQLEGQEADARTDIFAFGAVLYEMLTGKKAFEGKSQASLIAAILEHEPTPISTMQPLTPPLLDRIVRKCLAKEPEERWQTAKDLHDELQWIQQHPAQGAAPATDATRVKSYERLLWAAAIVAAVVAATGGMLLFRPRPAEAPEMRLQIVTPDAAPQFALSPDGRSLVFPAGGRLWLRPLDSETARPLAGTDGGDRPFWSPDSRSVGFFADGKLKRFDVAGGSAQTLADFPNSTQVGATWNADGVILVGGNPGPVERVPAAGGAREAVTSVGADQVSHRHPQFLPDHRHFLFFATGTPEVRGLYVGSLESKDTRRVLEADAAGVFVPPDYALFVRQETLFAQRLDLQRFEPVGEPVAVAAPVAFEGSSASTRAYASSSATGLLAYRTAPSQSRLLTWFDRTGRRVGTVGGPAANGPFVRLSPDGRYAALSRTVGGNTDVWLVELERNVPSRFTVDPASEGTAVWSPDGSRLVFTSNRNGRNNLYLKPVTGDAPETSLLESSDSDNKAVRDWSSDGRLVLYNSISSKTASDLWVVPVEGDRKAFAVAQTASAEDNGRFSPDSQWIAYQSDETGQNEIVVKRLSGPGGKLQVSTSGGTSPQWRGDGREIFYTAPGNRLMAVAVTLPAEGTNVQPGVPVPLFTMPAGSAYSSTPAGQRFLASVPTDEATVPPITVVLNWKPGPQK